MMRLDTLSLLFLACQLQALALFHSGFFSMRKVLPGHSSLADIPPEPGNHGQRSSPDAVFARVVLMIIDGLRADMALGADAQKCMEHTSHSVQEGRARAFVAQARAPTVTMPRLKALTSGTVPGFLDLLLNLGSGAFSDDSFVWQAHAAGKTLHFFGDNTWLHLFPSIFSVHDGTSSFFVNDFTEVDNNVTRHLSRELSSTSWDILVLHYLGLDHIGHVYGPRSPLACPKLREMDAIIQKIDNSLQAEVHSTLNLSTQVDASVLPNLLVVCSDHGMSNAGSHGGSSDEEMLTPLIFFSSAFPVATADLSPHAEQTDIAVTLSFTLGLPVPRNSLGHLLLPVMAHLPLRDKLRFLHINGWQLTVLLAPSGSHSLNRGHALFKATEMEHGAWIDLVHAGNVSSKDLSILGSRLMKRYQEALQFMSQSLGESLAQYDIYSMVLGIILEFQVLLILLLHHHFQFTVLPPTVALSVAFGVGLLFLHTVFCTHPTPPALCHTHALIIVLIFTTLACLNGVLAALLWKFLQRHRQGLSNTMTDKQQWLLVGGMNNIRTFLQLGCVGHAMSQAASSFVEEEHMIWYFLLSSLWLMIGYDVWQLNETCRWRDEHYDYLKKLWTDSDETWWTGWLCGEDGLIPFW